MSLYPCRQPVPWLSTAKQDSAHPSESVQGDPTRDNSALGAFHVIVQFEQQYAGRVPPALQKNTPKQGRSHSIITHGHVNAAQALSSHCQRGLPSCRIPPFPFCDVVGTWYWSTLSSAVLPLGFQSATRDLLSLSNGWAVCAVLCLSPFPPAVTMLIPLVLCAGRPPAAVTEAVQQFIGHSK